jgi:hypothetical protein
MRPSPTTASGLTLLVHAALTLLAGLMHLLHLLPLLKVRKRRHRSCMRPLCVLRLESIWGGCHALRGGGGGFKQHARHPRQRASVTPTRERERERERETACVFIGGCVLRLSLQCLQHLQQAAQ